MNRNLNLLSIAVVLSIIITVGGLVQASDKTELSVGQKLYVPAYSHIYYANNEEPFHLTITLSIRNTDQYNQITITKVDYYETQGKLLVKHLNKSIILGPLESLRYVIPEKDKRGGSGANFIVEWTADKHTNQPIVESIMIGTQMGQGVSFTSRAQVLLDSEQ